MLLNVHYYSIMIVWLSIVAHLRLAYQEIEEQKQLQFDTEKAAELELFMG